MDNIGLITLWTANLAMIICVIFRSRQCAAIVMPFPIAGLFIALPKTFWWLPAIAAVLWLMLVCTFRLRGIFVPEKFLSTRSLKQELLLMLRIGLPLAALVFVITGFVMGWVVIGALLLVPIISLFVLLCVLSFAMIAPALLWLVWLFAACPLVVLKKETREAKKVYCVKLFEKRGRYREFAVPHITFDDGPEHYRVSWMFYRKMQRAAPGNGFTYEKCHCPIGISWIKNVKERY